MFFLSTKHSLENRDNVAHKKGARMYKLQSILFTLCIINAISAENNALIPTNADLFTNKSIVVLGGTGYLGRAIVQEVLQYNPHTVRIVSRDEVKHFKLLTDFSYDPRIKSIIGDIRDYDSMLAATRDADIVFHVAALKRMDALESNTLEAVKTNIIGSMNVFKACNHNKVDKMLFISTDKACSPINIYGACKFVSEKIFTNYNPATHHTKCIVTRFGNILESTGSVIPIFIDKIKKGEDLTLTSDQMTRFIIDKKDAVSLICDALRYGQGGEIFIKRLPAMKIIDLIDVLKQLFNTTSNIKHIGLRPGEKLHEVLANEFELARAILFKDFIIIQPSVSYKHPHQAYYEEHGIKVFNTHEPIQEISSDKAVLASNELLNLLEQLQIMYI